ncbi:MAG TPA: CusA/CzcA family heavy metal efflux RND transporter [Candidatus Binatia bacterium]|jgi:cobalt-zinc-cadmium resistance protein CzcA
MLAALINLCVQRRWAVVAFGVAVGLVGLRAYLDTAIEAYPDVTNLQVNVIAQMPGLAPEEIERQITIPLERSLNGTPSMIGMRSESLFGLSLIFLTFDDDADPFKARAWVGERISTTDLPEGVTPVLGPEDTPLGEIFQYRLSSDRHSLYDIRATQQNLVTRVFKQVPGVADVVSSGGFLEEYHVEVDPDQLLARDLTIQDVTTALEHANLSVGGGFLRHGEQEMVVRSVGWMSGPDDVGNVVLKSQNGSPITVADVARIVRSYTPRRGSVGLNEQPEIIEGFVLMRRGENPSQVLEGVHAKVEQLNNGMLPKGMKLEAFYDRTWLVSHTLDTVRHNLLFGGMLILLVAWIFLRTTRGALIVAIVIPLCLLAAFIGLRVIGLPANLISMGAIDFGILVDGALILVENVMHEIRRRRPRLPGEMLALIAHAARDVARPTFFSMAIIIAALIPVFTLQRVEGRIFRPLALTYTFALLAALVCSLTLVPALCALALSPRDGEIAEPAFVERLRERYRALVSLLLERRVLVCAAAVLLLACGAVTAATLGREFLPQLDEGDFVIFVEMPPSIAFERAQEILVDVRKRIMAFPEAIATMSEQGRPEDGTDDEGVNMSETFVRLKPRDQWRPGLDMDSLTEQMRGSLVQIPGVRYNFSQPIKDNVEEAVSGVRGQVVLKIFGPDLDAMRTALERAKDSLQKIPGIVDLDLYRDAMVPQLRIGLDRAALARGGISVADAQDLIQTALAGKVVTQTWRGEQPIPVRVELPLSERNDADHIHRLMLSSADGGRVPLGSISAIDVADGRATINREDNSRFLALKFNVEGRDMSSVIADAMKAVSHDVEVPDGHYFAWGGEFENQQRAMARLRVILPVAVAVVLALLYAALGSGRAAACVIAVAPFAATGGVFALQIAGIPLSVSAAVGFIALLGQISLAGLLVLSAIDNERNEGRELADATIHGTARRFRAVLMAAILAILGLLPMALSHGVGSETQKPFAVVLIGGMLTTLVVTLLVLPVVYGMIAAPFSSDAEAGA